jgi:hypothetical protein
MDGEYQTRSINLAAYIYLHEVPLLSAINERGFDCFVFSDNDGTASRLGEEYQSDAAVPARTYCTAIAALRKEAVQARRNRQ